MLGSIVTPPSRDARMDAKLAVTRQKTHRTIVDRGSATKMQDRIAQQPRKRVAEDVEDGGSWFPVISLFAVAHEAGGETRLLRENLSDVGSWLTMSTGKRTTTSGAARTSRPIVGENTGFPKARSAWRHPREEA